MFSLEWSDRERANENVFVYICLLSMHACMYLSILTVNINVFRYAELISLCLLPNTISIFNTSSHADEIVLLESILHANQTSYESTRVRKT